MKLLILSLAFLFLMGCDKEFEQIRSLPDVPDRVPLNYDKIKSIYFEFELIDSLINKNKKLLLGDSYYCLSSSESFPSYDYSDAKVGKIVAYVYADEEKNKLIHKIEGKIETPNIEEHKIDEEGSVDLAFSVPVNKEEYLHIDFKNEKEEILTTHIYSKPKTSSEAILVGVRQRACYWMTPNFI